MIRLVLIVFALGSVVFFPWPLALLASMAAAVVSPLAPLAAGILADTLSFAPHAYALPLGTLVGATLALVAWLARIFFKARIMQT